ncbi:hypothetical protein [Nitrosomonas ureae]|uniref:Uncharacterized protein n=1 Tax=Nitrosomonas ureae TaxID=44577 RepID=A0A2T5IRM8_9PROT|nr:hypothetical protein [Nitrosomonas ureae]PTQ86474.1 hypothetical protein C8R28_101050 [Nitrosomonas ureae]
MSANLYLTIEAAALELAKLTFDEESLLADISSLGISEASFENMKESMIEASQKVFNNQIMSAAKEGKLVVRNPANKLPYIPTTRRDFFEVISVSEINAWLEKSGVDYKLNKSLFSDRNKPELKHSENQEVNWITKAREKADIIFNRQKKLGCDPSKKAIAELIAKEFENENILTVKGKRISSQYIERHALGKWNRPRN